MDTKKLIEILDKNIDQKGLVKDLAFELFLPLLEKFVADTSNKYDDMLIVSLKEFLLKKI